jgi:nucleoid-associated protein EbfC
MFGDLGKIMKLAGEMKKKMPELKQQLAETTYTAQAGGGAVQATVTGRLELADLTFGEEIRSNPPDWDMLEDLIKAAVSAAQAQAVQAAQDAMQELAGGMDLPGMDMPI